MFFDGIRLVEGAEIDFMAVPVGTVLPGTASPGELFFLDPPGSLYIYTGTVWQSSTYPFTPVNRAGDTMTGILTLSADPVDPLHAATKQYVDTHAILETQIADGSILARLAANETVSGNWTFSNPVVVGAPTLNGHAATKLYVDSASGNTDLTYTAASRLLESSTGSDVTLPLVSSSDAGLAPASGGGTSNFLRADGTWASPGGGLTAPNYETAVATAAQTVFNTTVTTTANGAGKTYLLVFVNGVKQIEGASKAYTVTGANQVTFNAGLALNDDVEFVAFV